MAKVTVEAISGIRICTVECEETLAPAFAEAARNRQCAVSRVRLFEGADEVFAETPAQNDVTLFFMIRPLFTGVIDTGLQEAAIVWFEKTGQYCQVVENDMQIGCRAGESFSMFDGRKLERQPPWEHDNVDSSCRETMLGGTKLVMNTGMNILNIKFVYFSFDGMKRLSLDFLSLDFLSLQSAHFVESPDPENTACILVFTEDGDTVREYVVQITREETQFTLVKYLRGITKFPGEIQRVYANRPGTVAAAVLGINKVSLFPVSPVRIHDGDDGDCEEKRVVPLPEFEEPIEEPGNKEPAFPNESDTVEITELAGK
jgi:hypothetical protein